MATHDTTPRLGRHAAGRTVVLGVLPLLVVAAAVAAFAALGGPGLGERRGPPAEDVAVERTVLRPGVIELTVRNDGPDAVAIAQAVVNDAFAQFDGPRTPIGRLATATVRIRQPWVEGEAYEVALVTASGGTVVHEIPVAVATPDRNTSFFALMALLGVYVGVIPVALGMLWLPWVRRIPPGWVRAIMGVTIGLLAFLAIDATLEGLELAGEGAQAFGGPAVVLLGAAVAFLALSGVSAWQRSRAAGRRGDRRQSRAARRRRHRAAQPRRGRRDRLGVLRRRARPRRAARRRLRPAQHDRGPGDRRAGRRRAALPRAGSSCSG